MIRVHLCQQTAHGFDRLQLCQGRNGIAVAGGQRLHSFMFCWPFAIPFSPRERRLVMSYPAEPRPDRRVRTDCSPTPGHGHQRLLKYIRDAVFVTSNQSRDISPQTLAIFLTERTPSIPVSCTEAADNVRVVESVCHKTFRIAGLFQFAVKKIIARGEELGRHFPAFSQKFFVAKATWIDYWTGASGRFRMLV